MSEGAAGRSRASELGPGAILAGLVLLSASCGARTRPIDEPDSGLDGDADADADLDADAEGDGEAGCAVPAEPIVVFSEVAPVWVESMTRLTTGQYVLSATHGWSGEATPYLWVLDGSSLALLHRAEVPFEHVAAVYDPRSDELLAVAERRGLVSFVRYAIRPGWRFEEVQRVALCERCGGVLRPPIPAPGGAAVAVPSHAAEEVLVFVVPADAAGAEPQVSVRPASDPTLLEGSFGPVLLFAREGGLRALPLHWDGEIAGEERTVAEPTLVGYGGARRRSGGRLLAVSAVDRGEGAGLELAVLDGTGALLGSTAVEDGIGIAPELSIADRGETVGVAWGEIFGEGRVGAHFVALDAAGSELVHGPTLVSPPLDRPTSSYSVRAMVAPHDEGFAVVWNGWHELADYGLYGLVVRCR